MFIRTAALLLLFLPVLTMAQKNATPEPYLGQWKKADSLLDKDLPQSARKIVDKVYADAQRTNQPVQMLKAQLYLMRIDAAPPSAGGGRGEAESADSLNIARAEEQSRQTAFPLNAIWQSITAQLYWNYYQQHRYEILQRTIISPSTGGGRGEADFEQWDAAKFVEHTSALYLQSLTRAEDLKRINIEAYDPVLIKGTNTRNLRPTLFDLLAFRTIDFFENDEKDLTKPAFQFVMDDVAVLSQWRSFMLHPFRTPDSVSMQYRALKLYQEVLRLHEHDGSPDALIDADLQRLHFVYTHSVDSEKRARYIRALTEIEQTYANNPLSATASFRIAELMMNGSEVIPYDEDDKGKGAPHVLTTDCRAVKAKLDAIVAKYPESEGGIAAAQLRQSITAPSLSLTAEEAVLPDAPSRILVTYKNVSRAWFRIVKMNPDDYRDEGRYANDNYIKTLLTGKSVQEFSVALPGTEDYAQHRAEVKVDELPLGMYAVIISAKESFAKEDNALSFSVTQSTQLAVITQNSAAGKQQASGYILDRKAGTPISGATLSFFRQRYNSGTSRYVTVTAATATSASDGAFRVSGTDRSYNGMSVKKGADVFYTTDYLNFYRYERETAEHERTFFFTNRSIYRPGQAIFFKGILVHSDADDRNNNVQAGKKVEVTFYDANSQKVATQNFTTNEWGSFTGSFTAPQGGLTGQMHIESGNGTAYISVEEYKRPKFRVEWDTLKSDYALNESVTIAGHAAAYAGNNVDDATVKYRVVRNVRWPYSWYNWRFGSPSSGGGRGEAQMAEGTATTDADGKFTIRFTAQPDRSIDERSLPVFTYIIYTDVTDLNGETRSGQKSISAGYRSLQIIADIPEQASRKDLDTVHIATQNLNGDFVAASINIKVARLAQPETIYRKRYWPVPDRFTMSEAEFRKSFPLDAYKDEDDYRNWKEAEQTFSRSMKTTRGGNVALSGDAFPRNGWYVVTISAKDKNGKAVEEKKFVQMWDASYEGKLYEMFAATPGLQVKEPGDKATVNVFAGTNSYWLIQQVHTMDRTTMATLHITGAAPAAWSNLITEADRGGIALSYLTVKDNRVYTASARIDVPWTNKDLSIEWETHRDKLLPGEKETWTMIVRGNKKDKVAAELVATLYDASLEAFLPHYFGWGMSSLFPKLNADLSWNTGIGFGQARESQVVEFDNPSFPFYHSRYDELLVGDESWDSKSFNEKFPLASRGAMIENKEGHPNGIDPGIISQSNAAPIAAIANPTMKWSSPVLKKDEEVREEDKSTARHMILPDPLGPGEMANPNADIPIRKNLQETAFFYPQLHTDADGAVRIQFTIPEALTEWKLLAFAHTKDMRTGYTTGTVKTQKDLMVQPGLPRFLRQGDEVSISTKIVNLSDAAASGTATLEIIDALTGNPLDVAFSKPLNIDRHFSQMSIDFNAPKGGSTSASWTVHVPESRYEPVIIRITARAGGFTDGEENTLPVITNRMLVTETLPLWMNSAGTKTFSFEKLLHSGNSPSSGGGQGEATIAQYRLTLEYTANPAWYAIQALPYLMEYPYECSEQTFTRFYANALAAHILEKSPKVKAVFKKWEESGTSPSLGGGRGEALKSPLEKNEELKSALLEETPWVLDAQDESKQRHNIALLFQTAQLARELDKAAQKLEDMFLPEGTSTTLSAGGWPWFKGAARPDRYITQYIVTGIGRLQHLGVGSPATGGGRGEASRLVRLAERAVPYLDKQMEEDYRELLRQKADMKSQQISYFEAQYLYARSFFPGIPQSGLSTDAKAFYKKQAQQFWPGFNPYIKGMIAIALSRSGDKNTPAVIIQSLKETSIQKEETGMYWMEPGKSWYWWEAPVEAQSLLMECFDEVAHDDVSVDAMKRWLLKNKQTNRWSTTKATADACYALLLVSPSAGGGRGEAWLDAIPQVTVQLGDTTIRSAEVAQEAGTGYFKTAFSGRQIKPDMGNITLTVSNASTAQRLNASTSQPSWGAVYWQYFENLDKITSAATPLVVKKALFIERNTDRGPVLEPVSPIGGSQGVELKIGDKVKARIEIIVDRDMEYVHLKDARAACFEPVNVLSEYKYQGGLGYYESTKDVSSNFFFDHLPKGKYVFEYPMFVTNAGDYSAGLATIQCMYAPEFSAHSEGLRVKVR